MGLSHAKIERRNRLEFVRADTARRMRDRLAAAKQRALNGRVAFDAVLYAVAVEFELDAGVVVSAARKAAYVRARYAVCWIARNRLRANYPKIGRRLDRDPTTILYAVRRAETLRATDPDFAARLARAEFELFPASEGKARCDA